MKVTKITFEQLYPTGQFANMRLGMEVSLEEDDLEKGEPGVVAMAYQYAKQLTNEAFKNLNPDLSTPSLTDYNTGQPAAIPEINRAAERLEILIDKAETVEDVERLHQDAIKYGLEIQYSNKIISLNNQS